VTSHASGRHQGIHWRVLAGVLALLTATCMVLWSASSTPTPSASGAERLPTGMASQPPDAGKSVTQRRARPVQLRIPSLDVATRLIELGLQQDGTVEVPSNPALAGWFRPGSTPGARGSSVILGHVDSLAGPAVFYRLRELQPSDRILVLFADGSEVQFAVRSVRTYPNSDFPAQKVYGARGHRDLNLVTCGGAYDAANGGYQANVVVNARRV
jgi:sortase (surface protein transpeptidase)